MKREEPGAMGRRRAEEGGGGDRGAAPKQKRSAKASFSAKLLSSVPD